MGADLMARFGRDDWVCLGLKALAEHGDEALRLEAITKKADKTRGSFYHHFKTQEAFIKAMMVRWEDDHTNALIKTADAASKSGGTLNQLAAELDHALELAIRRAAPRNPVIAEFVQRVDHARVQYLRQLQADPQSDAAADYALIEYACFCLLYTSPSPRDRTRSRMPSSA